jgi:SAM-dependent methyltransferase
MSVSVFDSSAANYDEEFTNTPIGKLQRKRVYKYLLPLINSNVNLLEVNCGTGHDAIYLATKVHSVYATDISSQMIEVAQKKINGSDVTTITFKCADISTLHENLPRNFDLLLSNFGGLNCLSENELGEFSKNMAQHITTTGQLALVIMGKKCWIENLWYMLRKDPRRNRRNTSKGLLTTINEATFYTYYYSPKEIENIFGNQFAVKKIRPIGLFIPPSYLNPLFKNKKLLLHLLSFFENCFGEFSFLSNFADHYIIVLKKKEL